jgi:hypothetical protein
MMVIMVGTFRGIDRQQKIIGSQPMPLGVPVREDTALQHLIVAVVDSGWHDAWRECQLLILIEEIVDVLVEHHSSNRLHINIREACQYGHIYIFKVPFRDGLSITAILQLKRMTFMNSCICL